MFNTQGRGCGPRRGGNFRSGLNAMREEIHRAMHGRGGREGREGRSEGRGGGRSRRMFDGGELRLVMLQMIADEPRHGYELIRAIEELTGGAYAPSPGVVYPTLTLLDEMGLIEEQVSEGSKKRFAATDAGRTHLEENRGAVDALMARLAEIGAYRARTDGGPVRRALGNLRQVLQDRLGRGDLSDDAVHAVVAMIDEVAQKIERLK